MKILLLSDIHANYEALLSIDPYIQSADLVCCLGDIVGYSCAVNEVIDYIRQHPIHCIQGNHDRYLIEGLKGQSKYLNESVCFGIEHAQRVIREDNLEWLISLPISLSFKIDNTQLLLSHGSPYDPINGYIYEDNTDFSVFSNFHYDLIAIGHTHRELLKTIGSVMLVNPGSVGQSRDYEGKACACIYDTGAQKITRIREKYDYKKNLDLSLSNGGKEWIFKHYQQVL